MDSLVGDACKIEFSNPDCKFKITMLNARKKRQKPMFKNYEYRRSNLYLFFVSVILPAM